MRTRRSNNIPISKVELAWTLSALLLSSQTFWSAIENTPLFVWKWHGWMLVYLSKRCIFRVSTKQNKVDVFKSVQMNTIARFLNEKLTINSLSEALNDSLTISYVNFTDELNHKDNNTLNDMLIEFFSDEEDTFLLGKNILIVDSFFFDSDVTENFFEDTISFGNNIQFEIRVVCSTTHLSHNTNTFNADVFERHGKQYKSWWFQNRNDFI